MSHYSNDDEGDVTPEDRHTVAMLTRTDTAAEQAEAKRALEKLWADIQRMMVQVVWVPAMLGALLLPVALSAQMNVPHHRNAAVTACVEHGAVSDFGVQPTALDSEAAQAHEAVHRRQLAVGCDSVMLSWDRDPHARHLAEAEAFCVGLLVRPHEEWTTRKVMAAQWWAKFVGQLSYVDYLTDYNRWCPS